MMLGQNTQGWRQFHDNRESMLNAFDKAKTHDQDHETQTYRGRVAEAEIRKWLSEFLPMRYGITSGYIISQGLQSDTKHKHFDVIIYDCLNSPTLWIENNKDASDQGRSRAIPVEHVLAVIEVKAALTRQSAKDAMAKLSQLAPLSCDVDNPDYRYKVHLPKSFFCANVFFELRTPDANHNCSEHLLPPPNERGHFGNLILRAGDGKELVDGVPTEASAQIKLLPSLESSKTPETISKSMYENGIKYVGRRTAHAGDAMFMHWSINNFSMFAFDILHLLDGTYDPTMVSSFYGLGTIEK